MKNNTKISRTLVSTRTQKFSIATGILISDTTVDEFPTLDINDLSNVSSGSGDYKKPNAQSYTRSKFGALIGVSERTTNDGSNKYVITKVGALNQASVWPVMSSSTARNKAISDLGNQLRGTLDLSVSVAQAGQVAKMVHQVFDLVHYVRKFPSHALKSMYKDHKENAKRVGSGWLAYQYGWKPLAEDIYQTANSILGGRTSLTRVKVKASDGDLRVLRAGIPSGGTMTVQTIQSTARCEIVCEYDINSNSANQLASYTSLNPASIAWELTPFSFVVDWVVDVGGYIRNLETALLSSTIFRGGYQTVTCRTTNSMTENAAWTAGPNNSYFFSASGSSIQQTKTRGQLTNPPMPDLPRFDANLGSGRLLNAAALLSQHLK